MTTNTASATRKASRALVIDDDKFMQVVLGDLLRDLGVAHVATAGNGKAGMDAIAAGQAPDVILCDLNMPGSDGFEFMEALSGKGYDGGVILVSGMDARTLNSASLMAQFHSLNILATLKKPVEESALSAALAKLG
jgi:CheY-like chemotaxis protein